MYGGAGHTIQPRTEDMSGKDAQDSRTAWEL